MVSVATRLSDALRLRGGESVRALHMRLMQAGVFGATYSTLNRYFTGEVEPSLSVVAVLAKALDVSPGWLAFGDGERGPLEITCIILQDGVEIDRSVREFVPGRRRS